MHKKFAGIFVTAGVLAFFLLALNTNFAEAAGGGLESAIRMAQQLPKHRTAPKPASEGTQVAPNPTPGPTPAPTPEPTPANSKAEAPAPTPSRSPSQMQLPEIRSRLLGPAAPKPEAMPEPAKAQPMPTAAPSSAHRRMSTAAMKGAVSFNFDDADVYSVIQTIFGDVLRVNYVIDPRVKGRVTFRSVEPVAKKDVMPLMEVILRLNGVGIVQEGGLYRIIPISDISKEPARVEIGRNPDEVKITGKALVQIVQIKYMKSSDMVQILKPFLSQNAVVVDVPNSNYIVIVDTDSNVKRLLQMVNLFDNKELEAVTPKVYVYPVQNGKAKDVANLLQQIFLGAKPSTTTKSNVNVPGAHSRTIPGQRPVAKEAEVYTPAGGTPATVSEATKIIPDEVTNSLIILATPEDYTKIKDAITKIDIAPRQVVIEALIVQVNLTDNLSFGLSYSLDTDLKMHPFKKDTNLSGNVQQAPGGLNISGSSSSIPANGFSFVGYDPTGNVRAVLTALEDRSKAKVVAAPHILVSDNKEASIQIGQQIPLATSTSSTPVASTTTTGTVESAVAVVGTSTIQYKDIGIILKVKPQVNDSGLINMDFSQEISSVGSSVQVGGLSEVTINKTEAKSSLVARDGETIVIGGLIRQDKSHDRGGIPFLSRIPIIGALFGNTTDQNTRSELIILLTPHVVRNQAEAKSVSNEYINRYKSVTKDVEIEKFIHEGEGGQEKQKTEQKDPKMPDQRAIPSPKVSP